MKRKADPEIEDKKPVKKRSKASLTDDEARKRFRKGLFDNAVLKSYTEQYATSDPYKHAVIEGLVDDKLLRSVRDEIRENVSFTLKETDIYKIHQSGDLANLDGLEDEALAKLPALLALRDAMYSEAFRNYVSHITDCGPLSGRKTDMAINVYTPGSFLLCHDDVIGSRKVSYILYLTDPDQPWQSKWGGALRLYPVREITDADGTVAKTPSPDFTKVIPPAWNQLSFFAVQPGESFHDVEEVYHADTPEQLEEEDGRVRMAISGWFHIPQIGEDGYVEGAEEKLSYNSGLMQLQGNPDQYDLPAEQVTRLDNPKISLPTDFDEADFDFLLKYMSPTFLMHDTLEQISNHFEENSSITLPDFLSNKFSARLREFVTEQEAEALPSDSADIEKTTPWKVARPPHKHRFLYQQPSGPHELRTSQDESPVTELLDNLLPSRQFRQWLQLATGCTVESHDLLARRFRRGKDYTLATGHTGNARLELNLGFTPTTGWGGTVPGDEEDDDDEEEEEESKDEDGDDKEEGTKQNGSGSSKHANGETSAKANGNASPKANGKHKSNGEGEAEGPAEATPSEDEPDVGGHEVYMVGDDDAAEDAAVYKTAGDDDEDNILFVQPAAWNTLSLVLRDSGALRFVKYVSRRAPGDRWDISGLFGIEEADEYANGAGEGEGEGEDDEDASTIVPLGESEEEFEGFDDDDEDSGED